MRRRSCRGGKSRTKRALTSVPSEPETAGVENILMAPVAVTSEVSKKKEKENTSVTTLRPAAARSPAEGRLEGLW